MVNSTTFDYGLADAQATAVDPVEPRDFPFAAYARYEATLGERCRQFQEAESGILVYRRMRVGECFSHGCRNMGESLRWQLGALAASMRYPADVPNFLEPWYGIGGSFGGGKEGPQPITEEEADRDYAQGPKEGFRGYMLRAGTNFHERLKAEGLPTKIVQAGQHPKPGRPRSDSVYLKGKGFEVRLADHKLDKGTKSERPAGPRYILPVEKNAAGRGFIKTEVLNDRLEEIVARHGK